MPSIIHPLTEEELDAAAHWIAGEDMYYAKEAIITDKTMHESTLRQLQETGECSSGVCEENGNKVAIFLKDGSMYAPAEYMNVNRRCTCKDTGRKYCTNFLSLKHDAHICSRCGAVMEECMVWL
jgi:hypothetical protein